MIFQVRLRSFAPATAAFVRPALQWIARTVVIQLIFLGLPSKQSKDVLLWQKHIENLTTFLDQSGHTEEAENLDISQR